jgi:hypothetical protein
MEEWARNSQTIDELTKRYIEPARQQTTSDGMIGDASCSTGD